MEFTEEERKELEKKYKEQRRAMWAGKRLPSASPEESLDEAPENSDSVDKPPKGATLHTGPDSSRTRTKPLDKNQSTTVSSQASARPSGQTRLHTRSIAPNNSENTVSANDYGNAQQIIQKTRGQREEIWEGNSATRSHQSQRWRTTAGKVGKFWNPPRQEEVERPRRWKLALGVFGAIALLISVGILLGYWFAS